MPWRKAVRGAPDAIRTVTLAYRESGYFRTSRDVRLESARNRCAPRPRSSPPRNDTPPPTIRETASSAARGDLFPKHHRSNLLVVLLASRKICGRRLSISDSYRANVMPPAPFSKLSGPPAGDVMSLT